ncbi:MAG TPA: right-handed parallel beta-helix repeat-containing protein [Candidatus Angelobacter sp.]|nr:right-handed parallel beta-helix repeat-containing protein [Candidatus Angelobacter sp.]
MSLVPLPFLLLTASASEHYSAWATNRFADIPTQAGISSDPDGDGQPNLVEFAFGTDPRVADETNVAIYPLVGTNGIVSLNILEAAGHQPGAQIDLYLSSSLSPTNWFRPWWLRTTVNSQPSDPAGSVRENFATQLTPTNQWFARASVQLIDAGSTTADYYVATNGSDTNPGTSTNAPFATLGKAASVANPGNLIYIRGGVYNWNSQASLSRSGTPAQPIRVRAFPGESPVLNFATESSSSPGIRISGNWWWLYGLEVENAGHNGILINGSSNVVERCVIHGSGDTGLHITASGSALASSNLVLNCDSYRNYDPPVGGNADGFTAKFTVGPNNVFRGCRSWNNSDDGWDFWEATNAIIVDHCMTFSNGYDVFDADPSTNTLFNGNGNGFKMGGNYFPGPHHYLNCVSFGNKANGFDQNNNTAGLTVDNCTAWENGAKNFNLNHDSTNAPMIGVHVVRNNLSIAGASADSFRSGSLLTNNSWQVLAPAASGNDVLSTEASLALGPRRDDGSLPETPFLRPVPAGRLVNAGVNNNTAFIGTAPDLGAYETPQW